MSNDRLFIALPENFIYTALVPIRIYDINYGNHLGHDALISVLHTVRAEFLYKNKLNELDVGGCGIILRDLSIVYLSECFFGDTLEVKLSVGDLSKSSFKMFYSVVNHKNGREVARSCLTFVSFNLEKRKPTRMPESFSRILIG